MSSSLRPFGGRVTSSRLQLPAFTRTVRFRLTVWYSSLLLIFGIAFVVALNVAARLDRPDGYVIDGNTTITVAQFARARGPGGATAYIPTSINLQDTEDAIYARNLDNLQTWSFIAVIGLAIASGVGGYILSGIMLRPVRDITDVAGAISATNLSRRINHEGPDDELKALADTFDSMIDRLEHSFSQQRQFVQDASHELRTPLAAIKTNIEVAELDDVISPDEARALFDTIKTQTDRLTRITEDLLLLTAEHGSPEREPVNLMDLGSEVSRQLAPLAGPRHVTLTVEGDSRLEAFADGDLLYRSVFNLVDNAIKYSGEGSSVTMRATREGAMARLTVMDNGAGIAPEALGHIFDRFYRVDKGRSRREGGTGLGLAIVRELVESMGGTVAVDSAVGRGTTFTVRLEAAPPDAPEGTAAQRRPAEPALNAG